MKTGWIPILLLTLSGSAVAADLTVYLTSDGGTTTFGVKTIASSIFEKAGIAIAWGKGPAPTVQTSGFWLHVVLAEGTPDELLPGALGAAYPFAGCSKTITVFYDRVRKLCRRPDEEMALLAYVLAHEVGHVLEALDRHSVEGVMKASWSTEDRAKIASRHLQFLEEDVLLIRQGLAGGCRRQTELMDRFGSGSALHPE